MLRLIETVGRLGIFSRRRLVLSVVNILAAPPEIAVIQRLRCALIRLIGFKIGHRSQLSEGLYVYDGRRFQAGAYCRLGSFCRIWDFCPIVVGDDFLASHGLTLISGTHRIDRGRSTREGPITIGNNVWIGINVTIVGPATIGDNTIIGANSLVMGDLEAGCIYAGSPAKLIRRWDVSETSQEHF